MVQSEGIINERNSRVLEKSVAIDKNKRDDLLSTDISQDNINFL